MPARLESPSLARLDSYRSLVAEFRAGLEALVPFVLKFPAEDSAVLLQQFADCAAGKGLSPGTVAHETFWLVEGDQVVGVSNFRWQLTDSLRRIGGNIGYGVRPSARRKGFATRILRETLVKARERGLSGLLVTCDRENIGSAKCITNNGGTLQSEEYLSPEECTIQRYWIEL